MSSRLSPVIEAALATGLPCFPCRADNKAPAIPGPGGYMHATADSVALRTLWGRYPGALVGVRTGEASGLSVLDIDGPKHPEADVWLAAHRSQLPETRIHQTRSGGLHFVFRHMPGVRNSTSRLVDGVDTRGEGGYAIWWPAAGYPMVSDAPPAPWPQWLYDALWPPRPRRPRAEQLDSLDPRRFEGLLRNVKFAREKHRNDCLFWSSCRLGEAVARGEIDVAVAAAALLRAAMHAGLSEREARSTIASGFGTAKCT